MTLIETMTVMAISIAVFVSGATMSIPWLARESMRSAIGEIRGALQLARTESVKRNWNCRLEVNTEARTLQIFDGKGTDAPTDDELLHTVQLPGSVHFTRPPGDTEGIGNDAVTFEEKEDAEHVYLVEFDSAGTVDDGDGETVLYGGGMYQRLEIFAAGGMQVSVWNEHSGDWNANGHDLIPEPEGEGQPL